ncbi:hypothetical protein V8E52_010417 [Russula decolorans]
MRRRTLPSLPVVTCRPSLSARRHDWCHWDAPLNTIKSYPKYLPSTRRNLLDIISAEFPLDCNIQRGVLHRNTSFSVSQQRMPIEHERIMNECTDRSEDSITHTNGCVDFSWSFHWHTQLSSTSGHDLCYSASNLLWSVWLQWLSLSSVVPGPETSKIIGTAASSRVRSCSVPARNGKAVCACIHVASCACLIATPHDTITSTSQRSPGCV